MFEWVLLQNEPLAPFLEVKLSSTTGCFIQDLAWNPGLDFSSVLAVCGTDGELCLYDIKTNVTIMATLKATGATCGKICQYTTPGFHNIYII